MVGSEVKCNCEENAKSFLYYVSGFSFFFFFFFVQLKFSQVKFYCCYSTESMTIISCIAKEKFSVIDFIDNFISYCIILFRDVGILAQLKNLMNYNRDGTR